MARMREQNEKIKQRRLDVLADEDAFAATQAAERAKQVHTRKVQEAVDRTREQNAKRKMDKIQSREWDSEKKGDGWSKPQSNNNSGAPRGSGNAAVPTPTRTASSSDAPEQADTSSASPTLQESSIRGSPRGRGARGGSRGDRGRSRGRGAGVKERASAQRQPENDEAVAAPSVES
ncbi:hypothetical protein FA95DRAFT_1558269 [Auriscalpium vulgare]|uniref:Uncharacterized protein n=1 Tax=Auriscalpium vulgare TaxID=40419 RepID=A0ACB8RVH7_9AGAM|nr:hypothetical protein FA95DRAFT_1558269 [Auriscalpium vulgare]